MDSTQPKLLPLTAVLYSSTTLPRKAKTQGISEVSLASTLTSQTVANTSLWLQLGEFRTVLGCFVCHLTTGVRGLSFLSPNKTIFEYGENGEMSLIMHFPVLF